MNIQQVIDAIAAKAGIEPAAAERAAGTILSVIQQEIDPQVAAPRLTSFLELRSSRRLML